MEFPAELAKILQTTEANAIKRASGLRILPVCGRCGGSGSYSFNQIDGSRCYGCSGSGQRAPKTAADKASVLAAANEAVQNGGLEEYLAYLAAAKRSKSATNKVMAAWKAARTSEAYSWQRAAEFKRTGNVEYKRDHDISVINGKMADAYTRVSDAARRLPGSVTHPEYRQKTLELDSLLTSALEDIAAAKVELDEYLV